MRTRRQTQKCFMTSTQADLLPVLAKYENFTIPELEEYYKKQGKIYSKAVLYENIDMLTGRFLDEDKPRNIDGRLVRSYKLNSLGAAWAWWLSLPDQEKPDTRNAYTNQKKERRRRLIPRGILGRQSVVSEKSKEEE